MDIFIEQGESKEDCILKISSKYNRPFQILSQKQIRFGGFLGLFSRPGVQVEFYFQQQRNQVRSGVNQADAMTMYGYKNASAEISDTRLRDISGSRLEDEKKKVLAAARNEMSKGEPVIAGRESAQQILDALKEIKDKVESTGKNDEHPAFMRVSELLKANDFSQNYIDGMLEKLRKEMSMEQLGNPDFVQDRLLEWIGESISIFREDAACRKPKIMILIGPTGVGKTTTLSKLAAIYGIGTDEIPAIDVRMITIDAFRICAKEQLEQIGNIMQIPVSCVVNKNDLRKEIALHSEDTDLFLIDTIGKSPKDSSRLGEMKEILEGAGKSAEYHLVISAATKTSDIEDIMRQFEPFNYKSVVLSKMDETTSIGNIISALAEKRKSISYITDGQTVPVDIRRASVVRFLINLDGFKVNREKIEKRFPSGEAEQFKWR
ncbi:MAG: AAA family ATPase [Treponema sp.]|nr:AAA family ATPase [Treponema sp.]